jgi:hypothetical protein
MTMAPPKNVEGLTRKGIYEAIAPYENLPDVRLAEFRHPSATFCKSGKGTRSVADLASK